MHYFMKIDILKIIVHHNIITWLLNTLPYVAFYGRCVGLCNNVVKSNRNGEHIMSLCFNNKVHVPPLCVLQPDVERNSISK